MPRVPEGKKVLFIYVPEDVDEALRKYVEETYNAKFRGLISLVVTQALREFIANHADSISTTKKAVMEKKLGES